MLPRRARQKACCTLDKCSVTLATCPCTWHEKNGRTWGYWIRTHLPTHLMAGNKSGIPARFCQQGLGPWIQTLEGKHHQKHHPIPPCHRALFPCVICWTIPSEGDSVSWTFALPLFRYGRISCELHATAATTHQQGTDSKPNND
jgi:hypothetical protein